MVINMFYLLFILISMAIISVFNIIFVLPYYDQTAFYIIIAVILYTIAVIVVDCIFAFIVRWIFPKKWFEVKNTRFVPSKKMCKIYEKIGVKKWKDRVLELGAVTGFRKNKISAPSDNEFVGRYIVEANYGVVVHIACMIFGFIIMLYPLFSFTIALPVALVNLFLNYLPFVTLRYNLPKLHVLYKRNERKLKDNN